MKKIWIKIPMWMIFAALVYKIVGNITAENIPILSHLGKLGDWGETFAKVAIAVLYIL